MKELIFNTDTTIRWSCRKGNYILWYGAGSILSRNYNPKINDVWQLNDGYSILLTNHYQNLPVTIKYPEIVAQIAPHFSSPNIPNFRKDNL